MTETEMDQNLIIDLFLSIHISQLPKYSRQIFQLWTRGQYLYTHQRGRRINEMDSVAKDKEKQWRRYNES